MTWHCTRCAEEHDGLPDMGVPAPDPYLEVPEAEREARTTFTPDACTVRDTDGDHYFVRGVIFIPVHGQQEPFGLGVWVSQSKANFDRYLAGEEIVGPTFGWLVNRLAHFEVTTFLLEANVHFRAGTQRPTIVLHASDHPLAREQKDGISIERAWEIVHTYMPG